MKPDDITDEERNAALDAKPRLMFNVLVAQNVLRDRRVIEDARRDEREQNAQKVDDLADAMDYIVERTVLREAAAAIRGGETPPAPKCETDGSGTTSKETT